MGDGQAIGLLGIELHTRRRNRLIVEGSVTYAMKPAFPVADNEALICCACRQRLRVRSSR